MKRNSTYDLMKIISMFLIVLCHVINHGNVLPNIDNPTLKLIVQLIFLFTLVHVNSFVLVTGYYQSTSTFKMSKVWSLINSSMFYKIVIMFIFGVILKDNLEALFIFKELSPFNLNEYWFIQVYIYLYVLSPFINILIKSMTQKQHKSLLLVLTFMCSILPYITGNEAFVNTGYSLYHFIYIYLIGAYLRKYPFKENFMGQRMTKSMFQLFCIFLFCFGWIGNFVMHTTAESLLNSHDIVKYLSNNIIGMNQAYSNPFIMIQSVAYFMLFSTFKFYNKWISKIASCTLGVYMIHEHSLIRGQLYYKTGMYMSHIISYSLLPKIIIVTVMVFIPCLLIEMFRQWIFKFIYKRKFSKKARDKYHCWIQSLSA